MHRMNPPLNEGLHASQVASAQTPRLSVVMPSFNQAGFIEESIRSVLDQAPASTELVVMDGASTDGTQAVLARLQEEFGTRLRWVSEPDEGPAQAINKAARLARGELLGWLPSDDLYAPGALQRAIDYFDAHPDHVMVYGEAEHIDVDGRFMERYPSLPPEVGIERFRDGCFICQPSVFIRREVWAALGGLDESYRASFDFELWLRVFRAHPGHIGFIDSVQAKSRLHQGGITLRFRETVAREGIRLLADAFGHAPAHWLLTCFEEALAARTADASTDLPAHFRELFAELSSRIEPAEHARIVDFIQHDQRLALALPGLCVPVHGDGWAGRVLEIGYASNARPCTQLLLQCRHASPRNGPLSLRLGSGEAELGTVQLAGNGPFVLQLPLDPRIEGLQHLRVKAEQVFVPADVEAGSSDQRELAFRVESAALR